MGTLYVLDLRIGDRLFSKRRKYQQTVDATDYTKAQDIKDKEENQHDRSRGRAFLTFGIYHNQNSCAYHTLDHCINCKLKCGDAHNQD